MLPKPATRYVAKCSNCKRSTYFQISIHIFILLHFYQPFGRISYQNWDFRLNDFSVLWHVTSKLKLFLNFDKRSTLKTGERQNEEFFANEIKIENPFKTPIFAVNTLDLSVNLIYVFESTACKSTIIWQFMCSLENNIHLLMQTIRVDMKGSTLA